MSYVTRNTAVAAALVTLGRHVIRAKREIDDRGYEQFESVVWELDNGSVACEADVNRAFQTRDYRTEPLACIIKAANAREWLLGNVVHGNYEIAAEPDSYVTGDLIMASCLVAENFYLRAFYGRRFYFAPGARSMADKFRNAPEGADKLDWQRRFLLELSQMLRRARETVPCQ